jgi:hypothetical protein
MPSHPWDHSRVLKVMGPLDPVPIPTGSEVNFDMHRSFLLINSNFKRANPVRNLG